MVVVFGIRLFPRVRLLEFIVLASLVYFLFVFETMMNRHHVVAFFVSHGTYVSATHRSKESYFGRFSDDLGRAKLVVGQSAHFDGGDNRILVSSGTESIDGRFGLSWNGNTDLDMATALSAHFVSCGIPSLLVNRGVDHGMFLPLLSVFPDCGIKLVSISIGGSDPSFHVRVGEALSKFSWPEDTALVFSGGSVHNQEAWRAEFFEDQSRGVLLNCSAEPFAVQFDKFVKDSLLNGNFEALIDYRSRPEAKQAHPTPDHFMPLLTFAGFTGKEKKIEQTSSGYTLGSLGLSGFACM